MPPQVGCCASPMSPRNASPVSKISAYAQNSDACTMIGPSARGRMWRTTIRGCVKPAIRAADTYSSSRTVSVEARTTRITVGAPRSPKTIIAASSSCGRTASTTRMKMIAGIAIRISPMPPTSRSVQPPA